MEAQSAPNLWDSASSTPGAPSPPGPGHLLPFVRASSPRNLAFIDLKNEKDAGFHHAGRIERLSKRSKESLSTYI